MLGGYQNRGKEKKIGSCSTAFITDTVFFLEKNIKYLILIILLWPLSSWGFLDDPLRNQWYKGTYFEKIYISVKLFDNCKSIKLAIYV